MTGQFKTLNMKKDASFDLVLDLTSGVFSEITSVTSHVKELDGDVPTGDPVVSATVVEDETNSLWNLSHDLSSLDVTKHYLTDVRVAIGAVVVYTETIKLILTDGVTDAPV